MNPFYSALGTVAAPLMAGYLGRRVLTAADRSTVPLLTLSRWQKEVGNLVLVPVSAVISLWAVDMTQLKLLALPAMGAAYHLMGTALALAAAWLMRLPARQRGVFLMAGMNSNLGLVGGLLSYLLYGEAGFAFGAFFRMLELPLYYLAGYPACSAIGTGERFTVRRALRKVATDPALLLPILGVVLGIGLSLSGMARPVWLSQVNALLIPVSSINLAFAIGVTLRVGAVTEHIRPVGVMAALKFVLMPAFMWGLGRLAGLDHMDLGLPFRVAMLLSFMPVGFTALVAATLFDLDEDLANALWFATTVLLIPVLLLVAPFLT